MCHFRQKTPSHAIAISASVVPPSRGQRSPCCMMITMQNASFVQELGLSVRCVVASRWHQHPTCHAPRDARMEVRLASRVQRLGRQFVEDAAAAQADAAHRVDPHEACDIVSAAQALLRSTRHLMDTFTVRSNSKPLNKAHKPTTQLRREAYRGRRRWRFP